ncbi:secretory phospholipase A2 receptor-like [Ictalurus furcatus]|uniref:secretory phospholipase A2 receptor-like n=1 Tax=Ictalurus furcatus TaxID=66913 RepID=UPI002350242C|nr:secretory phospholipase A2 receptor-like [Ictalurus furcatus]
MKSLVVIFLLAVGCGVAEDLIRKYIFINSPLKWSDAQSYCRKNYKDLATITTVEENARLYQAGSVPSGSWPGLRRTSGTWIWSDGEKLSFPNWFSALSFSETSPYDCAVTMTNHSGFLQNYDWTKARSFYCYQFVMKEGKTWEEALDYCRVNYTGLVSMTSESSLQQLNLETVQTQTDSVWIGLRFVDGLWLWVSGEQLGSLVSMPSCPAPAYRCGALNTTTDTLMNRNCNERLGFICA